MQYVTVYPKYSIMYNVLLYYQYVPIADPAQFREQHYALCKQLQLKGRVLIGSEGINGTVAGSMEATEQYKQALRDDDRFKAIQFKENQYQVNPFPKLKVTVRKEIVTLGVEGADPQNSGQHLTPEQWHALAQQKDVVILDGRNNFEAAIGKFKNAITPDIEFFRDFPDWVQQNKPKLENKKVLMYCTGGIRCERASALLKEEGIQEVYQLDGGIINYGKHIPNGLWEGSCYVFDERAKVQVNDDAHHQIISQCLFCDTKTDVYYNCSNVKCNKMILLCDVCLDKSNMACSEDCSTKHRAGVAKPWEI